MPEHTDTTQKNKTTSAKSRRLPKISRRTVTRAGIALIVILILGFAASKVLEKDPSHLGKVGDHIVTKEEVQALDDGVRQAGMYPESQEQLRTLAMNYHLYDAVAKEYGIEINDEQALEYLKASTAGTKPEPNIDINNPYLRYRAYTSLRQAELVVRVSTPQSGSYVLAHFDQKMGTMKTVELQKLSKKEYEAVLAKDKEYATNFINDVAAKLEDKEITFEQAMKLQTNDPKIGEKAIPTALHSSVFGKTEGLPANRTPANLSNNPQIQEKIKDLKAGEMTDPFIVKVPSAVGESSDLVDGFWIIVKVDSTNSNNSQQFSNIYTAEQHFKQKYGYEIYGQ